MYSETLQKEIDDIYKTHPFIKDIIVKIKEIDDICEMDLDTSNEREHMKVKAIQKIVDELNVP